MNTNDTLNQAQALVRAWASDCMTPELNRVDVRIAATDLLAAVHALTDAHWGYLAGITGLDLGADAGQIEVLYHFCAGAAVLTLRVLIDRTHPVIPSLCGLLPPATFYERELREMLGVEITGLTNTDRLFLPDNWRDGVYPLRKDAVLD
ncbi:MAG: NADH-quinone oxidoreductase subunit C [Anaerolinea sp.]|nr:NADH-quinone oxidoreductase subunit C [Anaerolinea sp.]